MVCKRICPNYFRINCWEWKTGHEYISCRVKQKNLKISLFIFKNVVSFASLCLPLFPSLHNKMQIFSSKNSYSWWVTNRRPYETRQILCSKICLHETQLRKDKPLSTVIRQKGESQNGCFKKTKHAKFSEKRRFLTPWYAHVRLPMCIPTICSQLKYYLVLSLILPYLII